MLQGRKDPAGDLAGAAGALMVVICIVVGFVMATLTIIVAKVLRRGAPDLQSLFAALRDNEEESGRFIGTIAGTVPIPEFFSPENMRRTTGASG